MLLELKDIRMSYANAHKEEFNLLDGVNLAVEAGKVTALNNDKYNILKQRNWRCDIQPAIKELGYEPTYKLAQGVEETIKWYKDQGWL